MANSAESVESAGANANIYREVGCSHMYPIIKFTQNTTYHTPLQLAARGQEPKRITNQALGRLAAKSEEKIDTNGVRIRLSKGEISCISYGCILSMTYTEYGLEEIHLDNFTHQISHRILVFACIEWQ